MVVFCQFLSNTDLGPATKILVEKVALAIGTSPTLAMKIPAAFVKAKAKVITAVGDVKAQLAVERERRAIARLLAEESAKQERLQTILGEAVKLSRAPIAGRDYQHNELHWCRGPPRNIISFPCDELRSASNCPSPDNN
jgi:hypothetical protein